VNFPRPKTGIPRRVPLWPETVAALRETIAARPRAKAEAHAGRVFLTRCGAPWVKSKVEDNQGPSGDRAATGAGVKCDDAPAKETAKLLKALGLKRPGLGFYTLRHVMETVGGEAKDQVALDHLMGHARDDMASVYRKRISDDRLRAVTDHVRRWLFSGAIDQLA
jgi:integrase